MTSREEFLKKLHETFKTEAAEGVANITSNLIELEKEPPDARKTALIEATFREAHSLKGAARAVNNSAIESICQAFESVFSAIKNNSLSPDSGLFDLFHVSVDLLNDLLSRSGGEIGAILQQRVSALVINLVRAESGETDKPLISKLTREEVAEMETEPERVSVKMPEARPDLLAATEPAAARIETTVRVSIEKLDNLFTQAEEMLALKQSYGHLSERLQAIITNLTLWSRESADVFPIVTEFQQNQERSPAQEILPRNGNDINRVAQFFEWGTSLVKTIEHELESLAKLTVKEGYSSGVKIGLLLDSVQKIISVPFSTIVEFLPKAARDLSKDKGKEVIVEISGAEMEMDRRILEELRNPLMHLLRNSIDHGIEKPQVRKLKNKPETGTIRITVERLENNRAEITISDDGAGVDLEKVRQKYVRQEKIPVEKSGEITELLLLDYLFKSGVSTSEMITDLSGRGLGLAIVHEKIEQLGGSILVKTRKDQGMELKIEIPLSMETFRGVHIKVGERAFVVPTSKIERVLRMDKSAVKTIENKANINYSGGIIPLVYLSDILEIPFKENENSTILILVLVAMEERIGFVADEILNEDVILLKKFNRQLKRVRNIAGATILGSGKVVPVLNVSDLLKSAVSENAYRIRENPAPQEKLKSSILVVEDSITSRMLLKGILETAGYRVSTAIDGIEGFTRLKEEPVDLVVSDVDMPRMSGIDMTVRIRSDKALAEIPVVLVTSLSKPEDRERGLEVGASAYILKSNFDQTNLLEVIERLIG